MAVELGFITNVKRIHVNQGYRRVKLISKKANHDKNLLRPGFIQRHINNRRPVPDEVIVKVELLTQTRQIYLMVKTVTFE